MSDQYVEEKATSSAVCNVRLEEFSTSFGGISIAEKCPVCAIKGARHPRKDSMPTIPSSIHSNSGSSNRNGLSATANAFMKLMSSRQLKEFDSSTDCRKFLKKADLALRTNAGIPESDWPRVFLYT